MKLNENQLVSTREDKSKTMEAQRGSKTRVRKPLGDCTNNLSSSRSSLVIKKPQKPAIFSAVNKLISDKLATKKLAVSDQASVPTPSESLLADVTPARLPVSTPERGKADHKGFEPCSVYTRRRSAEKTKSISNHTEEPLSDIQAAAKRKSKGKEIAEPFTCPPATKIRKFWDEANEDTVHSMPKACTAISKKKRGCRSSAIKELSQDYIEKQRAYFAEVDAFELSEEEVESIHDLD